MALNQDGDTIIDITSENNNSIMLATAGTYADRNIIFNVYKNSGIDTQDATATTNDIASGKTAYVNGTKITGNIPEITSGFGVQCTSSTIYDQSQSSQATINFGYKNAAKRIFYKDVILTLNVSATEFGDATAADVAAGKTFTSTAGLKVTGTYTPPASTNIQSNKTVTPTKSVQTVNPDSGYSALAKVTVNAIPSNYIVPSGTLTISENGTKDVTNYANVTVNVSSSGTTISNGSITNNTTLPWGSSSSGTINRGKYIKIGAGKYNNDLYYLAQANSGTKSITENGTNISVDGYQYVTVNVSSSGTAQSWPTSTATTASNTTGQTAITASTSTQYLNLTAGTYSNNKTYKINALTSLTLPTATATTASGTKKATIAASTTAKTYLNIPAGYNSTAQYYEISQASSGTTSYQTRIRTATVTPTADTKTLKFSGLSGTPTTASWQVHSNANSCQSSSRQYYVSGHWNGSQCSGIYTSTTSSSTQAGATTTGNMSVSASGTTLTITVANETASYFYPIQYTLYYTY